MLSKADFDRLMEERSKANGGPPRDVNTELLKVAAVRSTDLTGHPAWDDYLTRLQALLDEAEKELVQWTQNCVNAIISDEMRYAQRQVTHYTAILQTLKTVMELPTKIITEHTSQ